MLFGGIQKTTLVDYPGKVACILFTLGCNFRCPWCHNPELSAPELVVKQSVMEEKEILDFLESRKGLLQGVCITGGEPTVQPDLRDFIQKVKDMGFLVKLDSNGLKPDVLEDLIKDKLVDYIAMDIKNKPEKYGETIGRQIDFKLIKKSIGLVKSLADYEFRTTVVPGIVLEEDILEIAEMLTPARRYYLQSYQNEKVIGFSFNKKDLLGKPDLERIREKIKDKFVVCEVRG
jgi:pyruvate formate lyase activating enzyme